jgi:GAF domain-containing protein
MHRETLLARTLVELADTLVEDFDVVELLTLLTDRSVEIFDVSTAGILLAAPEGELKVVASSSEAMRMLELFELQAQEGPCLDCFRSGEAVVNQDLATVDGRWPRFKVECLKAGIESVNALPLHLRGETIGALNLFRTEIGAMEESDVRSAQAFADVATIAILQNRSVIADRAMNENLRHALDNRNLIEQAKGALAVPGVVNAEQAFDFLRYYARNRNLKLVDVARDIVSGALPKSALGSSDAGPHAA